MSHVHHSQRAVLPDSAASGTGHEGPGVVEGIGEDVTEVNPGDRVVLTFDYGGNCLN
ncbi:alcohol dehydrogenase catalytic domain-containing protein [Halalkalicoccus subterraneus]|uniref:alcohol dehydrogenase catalytic domain-containing protein n=1 Tax=Halalkalicoccus subterraneus TaxID=2675002 RepID=UPI0034A1BCEF